MKEAINIKRTNTNDEDFLQLIQQLDHELWNELNEDQATYDQYNKVPDIGTAVVLYMNNEAAGSGCFKKYSGDTVEIKRMFVTKRWRGKGVSKTVLAELEGWAIESGFKYALLETSIHFKAANTLYKNAGYKIIPNYDQYAGLEESVCMKRELTSSEFKLLKGIEYFDFEEDFVEENVRCIPMTVRFKMDAAGIKLKLSEWSSFTIAERVALALLPAGSKDETAKYFNYLVGLIKNHTGEDATLMEVNNFPDWANLTQIPNQLHDKALEFGLIISIQQWKELSNLQRFALLKLFRPGHENKNFPKAIREFGLL